MRDRYPSIEELRPREIAARARNQSSIALVPVGPLLEWHSWHLPLGTDGLVAESLAEALARRLDGVHFRAISLAMDEWRSVESKRKWGLPLDAKVFGMNFPGLPVACETHTETEMRSMLGARLKAIRATGFRRACIVNGHGGVGQPEACAAVAGEWTSPGFAVCSIESPDSLNTYQPSEELRYQLRVDGHAGLRETLHVLAFRPELVDLSELPDGDLTCAANGMLYGEPVIPAKHNPRNVLIALAAAWRESVVENCVTYVREKLGL